MSVTKQKIIIANWKANPVSLKEAQDLFAIEATEASRYPTIKTVICPPFIYLEELSKMLKKDFNKTAIDLGVQDLWEASGPFTGEISPEMVHELGVRYVLIGHSDRRYIFGDDDEMINRKLRSAFLT